ncbi:MAG: hypothetical protein AABY86_06730, partial [Bdellovibrionota bacterium]
MKSVVKLFKLVIMCTQFTLIPTAIGADFRLDQGGSMSNIPVHNQGNLGTCYAHAVSQATDAYIHTFARGNEAWHTSTTMLGTEYRDTFLTHVFAKNSDIEGGLVCASFRRAIKKHGACAESSIEGLLERMYTGNPSSYRVARLFNDLTFRFNETHKASRQLGDSAYQQGATQLLVTLIQAGALAAELPTIDEVALALRARTNLQFAHKFFGHLCKSTPRIKMANTKCKNQHIWLRGKRGLQKLIQDIGSHLKKENAQPIMISYCGN